jgi:hypothetical protein
MKEMCHLDFNTFKVLTDFIDPDIKLEALKVPARGSQHDICCHIEFKLEPDVSLA